MSMDNGSIFDDYRQLAESIVEDGPQSVLSERMFSQKQLAGIAEILKEMDEYGLVYKMIDELKNPGFFYDWNACCILQYFELELILGVLDMIPDRKFLWNSVGLSSILGGYRKHDDKVIDFLREVVFNSDVPRAWWRAAHSLEMIGADEALGILKRSLRRRGVPAVEWCLSHLNDHMGVVGLLMHSDEETIRPVIHEAVKKGLLEHKDKETVINSAWLLVRMNMVDQELLRRIGDMIDGDDYELIFYAFFVLRETADCRFRDILLSGLVSEDRLLRQMSAAGLSGISAEDIGDKAILEAIAVEHDRETIVELCRALRVLRSSSDDYPMSGYGNKGWREHANNIDYDYSSSSVTEGLGLLSACIDPEGIIVDLVAERLMSKPIRNPTYLGPDPNGLFARIARRVGFDGDIKTVKFNEGEECPDFSNTNDNSNLAFVEIPPIGQDLNVRNVQSLLRYATSLLDMDGIVIMIGPDGSLDDDMSGIYFKHVASGPDVDDFSTWRQNHVLYRDTDLGQNLKWWKRGLKVPVVCSSGAVMADLIGSIFGRDAVKSWSMKKQNSLEVSLGLIVITRDEVAAYVTEDEDNDV